MDQFGYGSVGIYKLVKGDDINVLLCSWRGKDDGKWGERLALLV